MSARTGSERLHPLTAMARGWVILVVLVWRGIRRIEFDAETGALVLPERGELIFWGILAGAYLLLTVLGGIAVVRHTRFWREDDHLEVETGWFSHTVRKIPYRQIFSATITRPFSARMLGLAKLTIAVGDDETVVFEYLGRRRATELRDQLLDLGPRRTGAEAVADAPDAATEDTDGLNSGLQVEPEGEVIAVVPGARLARARARSFLPLFSVIVAVVAVPWAIAAGHPVLIVVAGIGVLGPVAGWVWGIVSAGTTEVQKAGTSLTVSEGRFDKNVYAVPLHRVQSIEMGQPILWRKPGWYSVSIESMGAGGDESSAEVTVPVANWDEVRLLIGTIWPDIEIEKLLTRRLPARAKARYPFATRSLRWGYDRQHLAIRRGRLSRHWELISLTRLQSVDLDAGPFVRRRELASLNLRMVQGLGLTYIPGLDRSEALAAMEELGEIAAKSDGRA